MRVFSRPIAGKTVAFVAGIALSFGGLIGSCGTSAVGIEACRQIQAARCEALRACPVAQQGFVSDAQVEACTLFYRDQCLHGLQSAEDPADKEVAACVAAVKATRACAKAGAASMEGCSGAELVPAADPKALPPCKVISRDVQQLSDCKFVASSAETAPAAGGLDAAGAAD